MNDSLFVGGAVLFGEKVSVQQKCWDLRHACRTSLERFDAERMTMDDIASRAKVGKAAIYRRWSSKPAE
jgi:hypothetical protein